jgi:ribosomal protein S18 acetylase RimI-like enzyme
MKQDDFVALEELYYDFHEYHVCGVPTHLRHLGERDAWDRTALRAALAKILADDNARIFVAEVGECLAGLIEVYIRQDAEGPAVLPRCDLELQSLMIAAPFRRQRLARQLIQHAAAWAREKGAAEIRLNVWEFNEVARRLYEHMGFRTLQRRMALAMTE